MLLCDFHREQAWERWLSATAHGMRSHKDTLLVLMQRIAKAESEEAYHEAVKSLLEDPVWKATDSQNLRNWFGKIWLPEHKVHL